MMDGIFKLMWGLLTIGSCGLTGLGLAVGDASFVILFGVPLIVFYLLYRGADKRQKERKQFEVEERRHQELVEATREKRK